MGEYSFWKLKLKPEGEVLGEVLGEVFEQHLPFGNPCVYRHFRRKGEVGRCFYECGKNLEFATTQQHLPIHIIISCKA